MRRPILGFPSPTSPHRPGANEVEAARRSVTHALAEISRQDISSSTSPPCADLPGLLRRCLLLLPLVEYGDPSLAARCYRRLLASLGAILSRGPSPALRPALEVFAEGLVFSDRLRTCFAMADYAAPEGSRVFTEAPPCRSELHTVLELVCCHFISSMQDEGGFEVFLSALSWSGKALGGTPEISFQGALALVRRTCSFSLPAVVQAHLLLHASRCISYRDLDSHLLAFEHAMNLYVRYLPALRVFNRNGGVKTPLSLLGKKRPFNCCIKDATDQKLKSQINGLLSFIQLHSTDDLPINEGDIFGCSDCFIEENQHMLQETFRQKATMAVKSILSNILCCAKQKEMHESNAEVSEEIICLAAVLRVMGSSLLHILHHFSQVRSASDKVNVNYVAPCKELNVICEIIRLLGQHEANELHTYDVIGIIGKPVDKERASMLMLSHFASLSICCVRRRLCFLWKGCIIMMMMAMNLMMAEEEILGLSQFPIDVSNKSTDFPITEEGNAKVYSQRTKAVALQYKNIQKICGLDKGRHVSGDGSSLGTPQKCSSRVGKVGGQTFLRCHPEYVPNSSEWDYLVDFVECVEGKDYSNSLKQGKKFKEFKVEKWVSTRQSAVKSTTDILRLEMPRS